MVLAFCAACYSFTSSRAGLFAQGMMAITPSVWMARAQMTYISHKINGRLADGIESPLLLYGQIHYSSSFTNEILNNVYVLTMTL